MKGIIFVFCLFVVFLFSETKETVITVNFERPALPLRHFWKSTGLCPPQNEASKFLLSNDEKLNLMYIGALPNKAIKHVRIHWLFNMVDVRFKNETFFYDFHYLDLLLDWIKNQRLSVGFELMGVPTLAENYEGKTTNFSFKNKEFWYDIVYSLTKRYMERYGVNYVGTWRFETWNEPDLKNYNILNFTWKDYFSYVTACGEALRNAFTNESIKIPRLGGPAGLFKNPKNHPFCWGLLEKCNDNITSCPIQFISFHKKGNETASIILEEDLELIGTFRSRFPHLHTLPIANDEADILVNWSKSKEWRGDVRYAAMVVRVIIEHFKRLSVDLKIKMEVLSNDNAFLNYHPYYFTQRTLLARFQMNHTEPPHTQFVKKPVYSVMALLALLGDEYLQEEIISPDLSLSFLASRSVINKNKPKTFSLLVSYANDTQVDHQTTKSVDIRILDLMPESIYVVYLMDNLVTNPFFLWKSSGSPVFPSEILRQNMRCLEEPFRLKGPSPISNSTLNLQIELKLPSVALVHVCQKNRRPPGRVTHLRAVNITRNEVLLVWKDNKVNTKCVLTFEVEFQPGGRNFSFGRINPRDTLFLSFHFVAKASLESETTRGKYRVRAVDYWNVSGEYSKYIDY